MLNKSINKKHVNSRLRIFSENVINFLKNVILNKIKKMLKTKTTRKIVKFKKKINKFLKQHEFENICLLKNIYVNLKRIYSKKQ